MIDYATISNTSGSYPNVVGLNVTSPGAGDGTPWIKAFIDDLWGARQAIMNHANLTPNASTETASNSQFLEAMQKVAGNPGEVVAWMGDNADPSSLNVRLLPLNGQGILRANYPDLDTFCYVGDPDNPTASAFYRADDAAGTSRNVAGIYLILPDLRGYTIRGLDTAAAVDPDGAGRDIGDTQDYGSINHGHNLVTNSYTTWYADTYYVRTTTDTGFVARIMFTTTSSAELAKVQNMTTGAGPGGWNSEAETRMTNSAARWCIRY